MYLTQMDIMLMQLPNGRWCMWLGRMHVTWKDACDLGRWSIRQCYAVMPCCQSNQEMGAAAKERLSPKCFFFFEAMPLLFLFSNKKTPTSSLPLKKATWVFPKIGGKPSKMDGENFMENPIFKWMIWEYHYFWFNTHLPNIILLFKRRKTQENHGENMSRLLVPHPRLNHDCDRPRVGLHHPLSCLWDWICSIQRMAGRHPKELLKRFERMKRCDFNFQVLWANDCYT